MYDKIEEKTVILPPFKHFIMTVGEIPTSYLETMTYYEMLVWFTNYLGKTVIPAINQNGEAVTELQNLFVELQNYVNDYFENLDVQEEINNKLDDMVEQGTLQEIIADYLNSKAVFGYNTVAEMKEATNLIDGSYAKTLGYYSINDGGGALYHITNEESEIIHQEELENGFYANLIPENELNVKQFGAYGNGTNDDTSILQKVLTYDENKTVYFPNGEYLISSTLNFKVNLKLDQQAIITTNNENINYLLLFNSVEPIETLAELSKGKIISGGILNGKGKADKLLGTSNYMGLTIENMRFENPVSFGLVTRNIGNLSAELYVNNCYFYNDYNTYQNSPTGIYNNGGDNIFTNITLFNMKKAIDTVSGYFENIHPWLSKSELIAGSTAFKCAGNVSLIGCYADTYEKSFEVIGENLLRLVNCNIFYNDTVYDSTISTSHPPYIFYINTNNANIISNNLSIINNIPNCVFINELSNSYFNNTHFTGSENVDKSKYVSNGFNNSIKNLANNTDVRELGSGCYTNQNATLVNFIPNIGDTYGELIVFKSRVYCTLLYVTHSNPQDVYFCIGTSGNWRNWSKVPSLTQITS